MMAAFYRSVLEFNQWVPIYMKRVLTPESCSNVAAGCPGSFLGMCCSSPARANHVAVGAENIIPPKELAIFQRFGIGDRIILCPPASDGSKLDINQSKSWCRS